MGIYSVLPFVIGIVNVVSCDDDVEKRILFSDPQYAQGLELALQHLNEKVDNMQINVSKLEGQLTQSRAQHQADISRLENLLHQCSLENQEKITGNVYIRWGRKTCPSVNGTDMIYKGFAGGSWYQDKGGAANRICMPEDPEYLPHVAGAGAFVYGVEYEENFNGNTIQEDAPCAVCSSQKALILMIPARKHCHHGWTLEYTGILVSGYHANNNPASEYLCLDSSPEATTGGSADANGALFQHVNTKCGSLPCPPYKDDSTLPCVVCSK